VPYLFFPKADCACLIYNGRIWLEYILPRKYASMLLCHLCLILKSKILSTVYFSYYVYHDNNVFNSLLSYYNNDDSLTDVGILVISIVTRSAVQFIY